MAYYGYKPAEQAIQIGDNTIVSADIADGSIVNADLNSSAAIAMSKTQLVAGTGLTLSTNTLNVDAAQTQITSVGTIGTGVWNGTAVASAYLDADTAHLTTAQTFTGAKTFSGANGSAKIALTDSTNSKTITFETDDGNLHIDTHEGVSKFIFTQNAKLGIGTASPVEALHVDGQVIIDDASSLATNAVPTTLFINADEPTLGLAVRGSGSGCSVILGIDDSDGDKFKITQHGTDVGGASHFIMDTSGKIGIGTSSPVNSKLCVQDTFSGTQASSEGIRFISAGDSTRYNWIENNISPGASLMGFFIDDGSDNTSKRVMTVHRNGVGIGLETPNELLHIYNSSQSWDAHATIRMSSESDSYASEIGFHRGTSDDNDRGLFLSGNGSTKHMLVKHDGTINFCPTNRTFHQFTKFKSNAGLGSMCIEGYGRVDGSGNILRVTQGQSGNWAGMYVEITLVDSTTSYGGHGNGTKIVAKYSQQSGQTAYYGSSNSVDVTVLAGGNIIGASNQSGYVKFTVSTDYSDGCYFFRVVAGGLISVGAS